MSEVDNVFDEAFGKQDEMAEEAKEAKENSGGWEYEQIKYVGLQANQYICFRPIGIPYEVREKFNRPSDTKLILQGRVLKDDEKGHIKVNFPYIESKGKYIPDPDWLFTKLYNAVKESKWVSYEESDIDEAKDIVEKDGKIVNKKGFTGRYVPINSHTKSYDRIEKNAIATTNPKIIPPKFYPRKRVLLQVISRMDKWCEENKHAMVLSTKIGENEKMVDGKKKINYYPDTGVAISFYTKLCNHFRTYRKDWDADFTVKRYESGDRWTEDIYDSAIKTRTPETVSPL